MMIIKQTIGSYQQRHCGIRLRPEAVDIATRYWLNDPGTEFRWRRILFCIRPDRPCAHIQSPEQWVLGLHPDGKAAGRGVDNPPRLTPRLKKDYSYTSTPPVGIHGLLLGQRYLTFTELTYQQRGGDSDGSYRYGLLIQNNKHKKIARANEDWKKETLSIHVTSGQCVQALTHPMQTNDCKQRYLTLLIVESTLNIIEIDKKKSDLFIPPL